MLQDNKNTICQQLLFFNAKEELKSLCCNRSGRKKNKELVKPKLGEEPQVEDSKATTIEALSKELDKVVDFNFDISTILKIRQLERDLI